ncbi:hypothetical protein Pla110_21940 [Polystyrenella longa]|uniref:Uncharacterized protein n=1 Tax=Polystyrenella longa TaxID=2528007 RepID=A0A518CMN9_9PLAN|nr:hypothetical protein [Polystyrenella longa]QDU80464.1 hypothetical protein Pla110_21940 [Polystyrenella longa]
MSRIVVYLEQQAQRADVVFRLHKVTQKSLEELRTSLATNAPVIELDLFNSDYDFNAGLLRKVMATLGELSIDSRIYELPEGETIDTCTFLDKCQISTEVLANILNEADAEFDRQQGE